MTSGIIIKTISKGILFCSLKSFFYIYILQILTLNSRISEENNDLFMFII